MIEFDPRHLGVFMAEIEHTSNEMDRADAIGWLVVCIDDEAVARGDTDCVVGCYGIFHSPEEALVEAGKHDADLANVDLQGDPGWTHLIKPLYAPKEDR
jgi:hypothetical protein